MINHPAALMWRQGFVSWGYIGAKCKTGNLTAETAMQKLLSQIKNSEINKISSDYYVHETGG